MEAQSHGTMLAKNKSILGLFVIGSSESVSRVTESREQLNLVTRFFIEAKT